MKKAIFITVRNGSTRLPEKANLEIQGVSTIEYLIHRMKNTKKADCIVLCTTENDADDNLVEIAKRNNILYFRGSEEDKLERWKGVAEKFNIDFFCTADGDDIFCEPFLIDLAFEQFERKYPDFIQDGGLVTGAFTYGIKVSALIKVCEIKDSNDTEMMWVYFTDTGLFKVENLENVPHKFYRNDIRMTLDYAEDLTFFREVAKRSEKSKVYLKLDEIIDIIDTEPALKEINFFRQQQWADNQKKKTTLKLKGEQKMPNLVNPSKYLGNELSYIEKVLNSESWSATGGNWNQSFEKEFSKRFGIKYGVALNSGTSTLHAALEAAGVGPGDEVLSPAITVIMDATATLHANAVPVFVDVNRDTFTMDPEDLEKKITPKSKAIIVVSIYGLPAEMDRIMEIANRYKLVVIEDNAQCMLSTYRGRLTGTIGHMASYSFENTKHISCGEGGMIITNNEKYAEMVRKVGGHGFKNLKAEEGRIRLKQEVFQDPDYKRHDVLGWNYRMPEFNAAIALAQLERVDHLIDLRIKSAELFIDIMKETNFLIPQKTPDYCTNSYYTLGVIYDGKEKLGVSWQDFRRMYIEAGGDGIYGAWSVPYLEPVIQNKAYLKRYPEVYKGLDYQNGLCPVAEEIQPKLMQFKTNYRDVGIAKSKAEILKNLVRQISK